MLKNSRDVRDFMERKRLAGFATVGLKNEPHVVPVFFTYEDGKVYVQTSRESVKVRNLLKNNKVAVAVYSGEEAVVLRGEGRILDSDEEFARRTQDHIDKCRTSSLCLPRHIQKFYYASHFSIKF